VPVAVIERNRVVPTKRNLMALILLL